VQVYGKGDNGRVYALTKPGSDLKQGPLMADGTRISIPRSPARISSREGSDGKEAYSRSGRFQRRFAGRLRDAPDDRCWEMAGPISFHV